MCESHHKMYGTNLRVLLREYKGLYKTIPLRARRNPGNEAENIGYLVGKNMFKVIKSLHSSERKPIYNQRITLNNNQENVILILFSDFEQVFVHWLAFTTNNLYIPLLGGSI